MADPTMPPLPPWWQIPPAAQGNYYGPWQSEMSRGDIFRSGMPLDLSQMEDRRFPSFPMNFNPFVVPESEGPPLQAPRPWDAPPEGPAGEGSRYAPHESRQSPMGISTELIELLFQMYMDFQQPAQAQQPPLQPPMQEQAPMQQYQDVGGGYVQPQQDYGSMAGPVQEYYASPPPMAQQAPPPMLAPVDPRIADPNYRGGY